MDGPRYKITLTKVNKGNAGGMDANSIIVVHGVAYGIKDNSIADNRDGVRPPKGLNRLVLAGGILEKAYVNGKMPAQVGAFYDPDTE